MRFFRDNAAPTVRSIRQKRRTTRAFYGYRPAIIVRSGAPRVYVGGSSIHAMDVKPSKEGKQSKYPTIKANT